MDGQELAGEDGAAANAADGSTATRWHTRWYGGTGPLPHEIRLDMGAGSTVTGLTYLPRQDGAANGRIGGYEIQLSGDGTTWAVAATGSFADDATLKTVRFLPAQARYLRLRALTEAGNRGPWTCAAEVTPLGWGPGRA